MKKIIFGIFFLIFGLHQTVAQERINEEQLSFKAKSGKITKAIGWKLNNAGEWISNRNAISYDNNGTVYEYHYVDNFKWIQTGIINHDGVDYYIIMYEAIDGRWQYENIKEGWYNYKKKHATILTKENFYKLKKVIEDKEGIDYTVKSKMRASIRSNMEANYYTEKNLLINIGYNFKFGRPLMNEKEDAIEDFITVNSQTVKGVDIVRFRLNDILDLEYIHNSDKKSIKKNR